jgi:hypothetical protein
MLSGVAKVETRLKFISASAGIAATKARTEETPKSRMHMGKLSFNGSGF